jgi:hypothetical protein
MINENEELNMENTETLERRIRTVEKDPEGGWIARDPFDGHIIPDDSFRWNSRDSARGAVTEARMLRGA